MVSKSIIEMARDADPKANLTEPYCLDHETTSWLERFAELVRADEREARAKAVGGYCITCPLSFGAEAIRARGNT